MKNNTYKILFFVAVIAILGLLIKLAFPSKDGVKLSDRKETTIIDDAMIDAKKLAESVNSKGLKKATFERKADIIGNGDLSKLPISQSVLDSLMLDNTDKTKKYQSVVAINATLSAKGLKAEKQLDSLSHVSYFHQDSTITARFTLNDKGGIFDITGKIRLATKTYTEKKNIFAPTRYFTDVLVTDKRLSIESLKQLTISPPPGKSKVGFGVTLGYGIQLGNNNELSYGPQITAGIQYRF
ncbi:hypothetical protein ACVWYG_002587 [Pedobacter sp. UYEF25]